MKNCIVTEEGLACINQCYEKALDSEKKPYLFKAALNYSSSSKASTMSFVELFEELAKYIDDEKRRWKSVLRVKRGLMDSSEPGGLYKDQVYLEGAVAVLRERRSIDFKLLYCGKLLLEDIKKPFIMKRAKLDTLVLPPFMENMDLYMKALDVIAKTNFIDYHARLSYNNRNGKLRKLLGTG